MTVQIGGARLACEGGTRNKATQKEMITKQHTCRSDTNAHTLHDGQRTHPSTRHQTKERGSVEKTHHCDGLLLHENEVCRECSINVRRIMDLYRGEDNKRQNIMRTHGDDFVLI